MESTQKVWGGRFAARTDPRVDRISESLHLDGRLARVDALANSAHVRMLVHTGILQADAAAPLLEALRDLLRQEVLDPRGPYEDVHTWLEAVLKERAGAAAENLRIARSRNDLVATDLRLWVRQALLSIAAGGLSLQAALLRVAERHLDLAVPGYTHLQRAQPVTVGHHLLAYFSMLERDLNHLAAAWDETNAACPLGAGSLATATWPVDPAYTAELLGFATPFDNSMDAVSDRDFVLSTHAALTVLMLHLSRLAEDLILWTSAEFGFAVLDDAFATGSSLMPQKKNPDVLELTRGRAAIVLGNLTGALALLKGLPLTYNRDLQEDKPALFTSVDLVMGILDVLPPLLDTLRLNPDACARALQPDHLLATDLADMLVRSGHTFAAAHAEAGRLVALALERNVDLADLPELPAALREQLQTSRVLAAKKVPGGPGDEPRRHALKAAQSRHASQSDAWRPRRHLDEAAYARLSSPSGA
ncbi:MAG: argininosuccinate lyase [Candidatus Xenobia bacterium]